jgi:hypothetical protein
MPFGLRVYAANGAKILDSGYRMGRFLGVVRVSDTGSIDVPGFSQGAGWFFVQRIDGFSRAYPTVSISGQTLSWVKGGQSGAVMDCYIFYGVR